MASNGSSLLIPWVWTGFYSGTEVHRYINGQIFDFNNLLNKNYDYRNDYI